MREDVYRVVKAFAEKKEVLSAQAQRFVDRVVSPLFAAWLEKILFIPSTDYFSCKVIRHMHE